MINRAKSALLLSLALSACATSGQVDKRIDEWEAVQREEVEALKRAIESSYDRERAMADRLHQTEEANKDLRQELNAIKDQNKTLRSEWAAQPSSPAMPDPKQAKKSDAFRIYKAALEQYNGKKYSRAIVEFDRLLAAAPFSEWSDNAQYWKGECYWGMGNYRQALTEFTKVFAFSKTEKADDAQLKIARCHLALGERNKALTVFRKLLDEYPESEYLPAARKEMKYLGG